MVDVLRAVNTISCTHLYLSLQSEKEVDSEDGMSYSDGDGIILINNTSLVTDDKKEYC